ncbi:MAG: riboflavin synthase [Calditrichaeota bacterium]|nr:riboflavin synthase [Calditrichota bacterium]
MFTGLIEEIGTVRSIQSAAGKKIFEISASRVLEDLQVDHSIAVNGVCLTVTRLKPDAFFVDAVEETLNRSTLRGLKENDAVNLERAMRLSDRLGGHIVQGHVDGVGKIIRINQNGGQSSLIVEIPENLEKYAIGKGSVAINGVSLTIAAKDGNRLQIAVIPHTWQSTTFQFNHTGDAVNIEVDFFAKYIEQFFSQASKTKITENWLKEQGFD